MAGKKKSKSNSKKGLTVLVSVVIILIAAAWFLGGKPYIEIGAEGVTLVQTEEPLAVQIYDVLTGQEEQNIVEPEDSSADPETATAVPELVEGPRTNISPADLDHLQNDPLFFGNPSDAIDDTTLETNYLMVKPQYTLSYNAQTFCPNWVAWHLDTENMGSADRMDDFRPDPQLPQGWYGIKKADYQYNKYGFDRGHVCPSADRTSSKEDNSMTFLMTNMVPQSPDNNRIIWMHFENFERELVKKGNEVYIIAGPYGTGGTSSKGTFDEIPVNLKNGTTLHMNVPAYTWKVLIAIPSGDDDLNRISSETTAIAINVPNRMGMQKTGDWEQFLCSIDEIESMTGYDFFELLPDDIEDVIEKKVYNP